MEESLIEKIQNGMTGFSKKQKNIAKYIIEHYDKAAFMTASKLGSAIGVSESTVVRFAAEIGYEGYPKMQRALAEMVRTKLTSVQRIEVASDRLGDADLANTVFESDIDKIRMTMEELDHNAFDKAVDAIIAAKRIFILGVRSSASLASFIGFYFTQMFDDVRQIRTSSTAEVFEQMIRMEPDDVLIGISFPRYSSRTVKAMQYAHKKGATTIGITDSMLSPLASAASHVLVAKSDMASFVDSLVAPLSVINALIVAVGMRKSVELTDAFNRLESVWEEYQVYEKQAL